MLTADACRAVLIALLLVVPALGHRLPLAAEFGAVYAVVAAESAFAQFFSPSRLAVLGLIVAPVDRPQASAAPPLFLAAIPQRLMGRVMSVFTPLQQVANITSIAAAGLLAGIVLRGMHLVVAGVTFGPVDTIFAASAVLIIVGGLVMIRPLSGTARS
jgi:hypothetical protein